MSVGDDMAYAQGFKSEECTCKWKTDKQREECTLGEVA